MSAAFVCWNPFQFMHFLPVVAEMPDAVMVVEARPKHLDALQDTLIDQCPVPVLFWPSRRMSDLDGAFDVLVCQTRFPGLEGFRRTPVAMLMYGLAKEAYNYGDWRSLAQLQLVYGEHSRAKMHPHGEVAVVGNPRFDRWHDPRFHEAARQRHQGALSPNRPSILYAPTWGALSSVDRYLEAVIALARDYNVLLKLHHNTQLLEHTRVSARKTSTLHVFGADDDLLELLSVTDLVLSDYSGAVFDALCAERPVVLLHDPNPPFGEKLDETSIEHAARGEIGPVVYQPSSLQAALQAHLQDPTAYRSRNELLRRSLFVSEPGAAERAAAALTSFAERSRSQRASETMPDAPPTRMPRSRSRVLSHLRALPAASRAYAAGLRTLRAANPLLVRNLSRVAHSPLPLVMAARAASDARDQPTAYELLRHAQRQFPANRSVIMALTELYRGDGATVHARATLRLERLLDPIHGGVRWLALETSVGELERAETLLDQLLPRLSPGLPSQHLGALFRAAAPVHGREPQLRELRARLVSGARLSLAADAVSAANIEGALRVRALPLARVATTRAASTRSLRMLAALRDYQQVRRGLGDLEHWAELAWHNESELRLHAVDAGRTEVADLQATRAPSGKRLVDFYLPTPFFEYTDPKPTNETVREAFRSLGAALARREDIAVVPRLQFNWRTVTADPRRPTLSYHTHEPVPTNHLHVQEAALPARVSVDGLGYAGYSSPALEHELVDQFAATRTDAHRRATFDDLIRTVVSTRASKYVQPNGATPISGAYLFLPMQVVTDPVSALSWTDQLGLLRVVSHALKGSGKRVVVKRHPYCRSLGVARALQDLASEGTLVLAEASIHDLISGASAVVTVNSGVGLEALLQGKPVIAAGRAVYGYAANFAPDAITLTKLLRDPPTRDLERAMRFFDYYMHVHTLDPTDQVRMDGVLEEWSSSW